MNVDSLTNDVQAFVLSITIEVFVPLCYAVSFSLAYTGPNASVMGNVSSSMSSLFAELPF